MARYRKKPVVIEAFQPCRDCPPSWFDKEVQTGKAAILEDGSVSIETLEGTLTAPGTSMVIRGVKGEVYACDYDIFQQTYEPA